MNKFTKATKRIATIGAAATIVASSVFGASLASYPSNFVKNGSFSGKVVVGAAANAADNTAATAIIDDLKTEFSGSSEKVTITYEKDSASGTSLNAARDNSALNYGETLTTVSPSAGFDKQDSSLLADGRFKNGVSDEDYEQTLKLSNGKFNYALQDSVTGVTKIQDGIYFKDGDVFATYTLDLKNDVAITAGTKDADFVGKTISIMGNDFTIGEVSSLGDKLVLLGGANKVSLGEGESTKVTVDGKSYDVGVQSVSSDKVLLTVNGQSKSISQYDSDSVSGISVAVTDLVQSNRDSVKGYAEIVVGGQKITLENNKRVKINDEDVNKAYPMYDVTAALSAGSKLNTITLTYKVNDDVLLSAGDSLKDILFQTFAVKFEGTNNPTYSETQLTVDSDDLKISANTVKGQSLDRSLLHMGDKAQAASAVWLKGEGDEDRILVKNAINLTGTGSANLALSGLKSVTAGTNKFTFDLNSNDVKGSGFLLQKDLNEQYLYTIDSIDIADTNRLVDFAEILRGAPKTEVKEIEWNSKLGYDASAFDTTADNKTTVLRANLGNTIALADNLLLNVGAAETNNIGTTPSVLAFNLDVADTDSDNAYDAYGLNISVTRDSTNKEFDINTISLGGQTNSGSEDNVKGNSDVQTLVNAYGIKVEYDNKDKTYANIFVPNKEVEGKVSLVFGQGASTMTKTVDKSAVDAAIADLKKDGNTIVKQESATTAAVTFGITAPVLDTDATVGSTDLIVVGGPAVNLKAAELLGLTGLTSNPSQYGVAAGEAIVKYLSDKNSVLVYGYSKEDTMAAATRLASQGYDN